MKSQNMLKTPKNGEVIATIKLEIYWKWRSKSGEIWRKVTKCWKSQNNKEVELCWKSEIIVEKQCNIRNMLKKLKMLKYGEKYIYTNGGKCWKMVKYTEKSEKSEKSLYVNC